MEQRSSGRYETEFAHSNRSKQMFLAALVLVASWATTRCVHGAGIDFVVAGHSHQYERFRPIEPPGKGGYVTYITAGGGGAPLAPVEPNPCHASAGAVYHFCLFHIQGGHLTMDTIDIEGRTIDHLGITKTDGRLDES
jgi:hypothetical protein